MKRSSLRRGSLPEQRRAEPGTMGPRRLLLVAACFSLCGPLLSARTRARRPGESCTGMGCAGGGTPRGDCGGHCCAFSSPLPQFPPKAKLAFGLRSRVFSSHV